MRACCQTMRMPGRARSHGCLPRSPRWSRRSLIAKSPGYLEGDETWYEQRLSAVEERIRKRLSELSGRLGDADWLDGDVQRRRPSDGVGAAQVERIGYTGRISEPLRLCRPRRSAARIQACFRRSVGGFHRRIDRLRRSSLKHAQCALMSNRTKGLFNAVLRSSAQQHPLSDIRSTDREYLPDDCRLRRFRQERFKSPDVR